MPFDAVSTGCAVELSQKRHMTKTDTHVLRHRCPITTHPRVGVLRIAVRYYATKIPQEQAVQAFSSLEKAWFREATQSLPSRDAQVSRRGSPTQNYILRVRVQ